MNTENNNTLIAEFMEVEVQDEVYFILPQFPYCNQLTDYNTYDSYKKETLEYHKNWNWLMSVVEKIESLEYTVNIEFSTVFINHSDDDFEQIIGFGEHYSKIQAVYNACIEFIKYHNGQKL